MIRHREFRSQGRSLAVSFCHAPLAGDLIAHAHFFFRQEALTQSFFVKAQRTSSAVDQAIRAHLLSAVFQPLKDVALRHGFAMSGRGESRIRYQRPHRVDFGIKDSRFDCERSPWRMAGHHVFRFRQPGLFLTGPTHRSIRTSAHMTWDEITGGRRWTPDSRSLFQAATFKARVRHVSTPL